MDYKSIEKVNSEIKFTQIKGKDYALVASRVQAFRKLFPEGFIRTKLHIGETSYIDGEGVEHKKRLARCTATVGFMDLILATGHAEEIEGSSQINRGSFVENCETSAVGRALAFLGIGSNEDIASAEEVVEAQGYDTISEVKAKALRDVIKEKGKDEGYICKFHKVKKLEDLTSRQYAEVVKWLG